MRNKVFSWQQNTFFVGIVIDLFICCFLVIISGFYLYAVSAIYSCPWENHCSFQRLLSHFFFSCFKSNSFLSFQAFNNCTPHSYSLRRVMTLSAARYSNAPGESMWGLAITTDTRETKCPSREASVLGWLITFPFRFLIVHWAGGNGVDPRGICKGRK